MIYVDCGYVRDWHEWMRNYSHEFFNAYIDYCWLARHRNTVYCLRNAILFSLVIFGLCRSNRKYNILTIRDKCWWNICFSFCSFECRTRSRWRSRTRNEAQVKKQKKIPLQIYCYAIFRWQEPAGAPWSTWKVKTIRWIAYFILHFPLFHFT